MNRKLKSIIYGAAIFTFFTALAFFCNESVFAGEIRTIRLAYKGNITSGTNTFKQAVWRDEKTLEDVYCVEPDVENPRDGEKLCTQLSGYRGAWKRRCEKNCYRIEIYR